MSCKQISEKYSSGGGNDKVSREYKKAFGRTLFHVFINLGLEPPECLPNDTEMTTSESRTIEENIDEVDGAMFTSPR
ncbi:unnamed protein product [Trichobilharzia regenti]|nr:unnamed protein product [Trichobilharzia regenti]